MIKFAEKSVVLGIGCRRGVSAEAIEEAVQKFLKENEIDRRAVRMVASIDVKADEAGLAAFAAKWKLPLTFYSAEELSRAEGEFSESEFVRSAVEVGNVCERAAVLAGGRLTAGKRAENGVTVAAAAGERRIEFYGESVRGY